MTPFDSNHHKTKMTRLYLLSLQMCKISTQNDQRNYTQMRTWDNIQLFFFLSGIEQGWKKTVCLHQWKVNNPRETNISQNHLYNWLLSKKNKVRMNSLTAEHDKTATKKALQLLGYSCFRDKTIFWSLINKRPRLILSWSFLHQFCIRNHHLLKLFCNNRSPPQFQQDRFTFPLDSLMHILRPLVIMPLCMQKKSERNYWFWFIYIINMDSVGKRPSLCLQLLEYTWLVFINI